MSLLYIVATPIGNLGDLSFRAVAVLKEVNLILAEDTRVAKHLLSHFDIKTPVLSCHQHSKFQKLNYIAELLNRGKNLALISDAGTPGISDPGNKLIRFIATRPGLSVKIAAVPGPSALTAAASVSGLPMDRFLFLGFPPAKKKRKKFFQELANSKYSVIFYESPHRIIKTLEELSSFIEAREIVVLRELTKVYESIYRGTTAEVVEEIKKGKIKGEFVVTVQGAKQEND